MVVNLGSRTRKEEHRLRVFEERVLGKQYGVYGEGNKKRALRKLYRAMGKEIQGEGAEKAVWLSIRKEIKGEGAEKAYGVYEVRNKSRGR